MPSVFNKGKLKLDKVSGLRADRVQTQYVPLKSSTKAPTPKEV